MAKRRAAASQTFIQRSRAVAPEAKALYHDELGAGRSRIKRPFFQLTAREEAALAQEMDRRLGQHVAGLG